MSNKMTNENELKVGDVISVYMHSNKKTRGVKLMALINIPCILVIDDPDDFMSDISNELHIIDVNNLINSKAIYLELPQLEESK